MGKRSVTGAVLLSLIALAGCGNNPTDTPDEFDIAFVELRIGTQAARVGDEGVAEGQITLPIGDTIGSIVFVDTNGEEVEVLEDGERNVVVSSGDDSIVTWSRLNKVTGIVTGLAPGSAVLSITLSHDDHNDFGPQSIPVVVTGAGAAH